MCCLSLSVVSKYRFVDVMLFVICVVYSWLVSSLVGMVWFCNMCCFSMISTFLLIFVVFPWLVLFLVGM
jgi:hypothetical protein